jgi:hypothetical protein
VAKLSDRLTFELADSLACAIKKGADLVEAPAEKAGSNDGRFTLGDSREGLLNLRDVRFVPEPLVLRARAVDPAEQSSVVRAVELGFCGLFTGRKDLFARLNDHDGVLAVLG